MYIHICVYLYIYIYVLIYIYVKEPMGSKNPISAIAKQEAYKADGSSSDRCPALDPLAPQSQAVEQRV